eukprot:366130-Chlamydomonas_euryale.AAC.48
MTIIAMQRTASCLGSGSSRARTSASASTASTVSWSPCPGCSCRRKPRWLDGVAGGRPVGARLGDSNENGKPPGPAWLRIVAVPLNTLGGAPVGGAAGAKVAAAAELGPWAATWREVHIGLRRPHRLACAWANSEAGSSRVVLAPQAVLVPQAPQAVVAPQPAPATLTAPLRASPAMHLSWAALPDMLARPPRLPHGLRQPGAAALQYAAAQEAWPAPRLAWRRVLRPAHQPAL